MGRIFDLTLTGQLSLDLANTIDWRTSDSPVELLNSYSDLLRWGRHTGVLREREARELARAAAEQPERAAAALKRARALREALVRIFSAAAEGRRAEGADLDFLNRSLPDALSRLRLRPDGVGYQWEWKESGAELEKLLWPVIRAAGDFLASAEFSGQKGRTAESVRAEQGGPSRLLLLAAFAAVYLIWGSTYLGIKYAIETIPPFLMAGSRFLVAGAVLYLWARIGPKNSEKERERPLPSHWRTAVIVGVLLFLCGNGGVTWAEGRISSSLAALLVATEPLWIVLLSWTLPGGVRPTGRIWLGLALGFAGVWLLIITGTAAGAGDSGVGGNLLGACIILGASIAWAVGSLHVARASVPRSPLLSSGMQMLAGGAFLFLLGVATGELSRFNLHSVSLRSTLAFLYLTAFGSVVVFTAYCWLLRNASPAHVSTYAYVNPAVAVLLGWALAGETLTTGSLLAAGVIVASVALITFGRKGHREKARNQRAAMPEGGSRKLSDGGIPL